MAKFVTGKEALQQVKSGMTIMIGGFLGIGNPEHLIDMLLDQDIKDLTIIANDTVIPGKGIGKLVNAGVLIKVIASHIGTNPVTGKLMSSNQLEVDLVPQGTLAERIRAGGVGLGGILTPTGVGTLVEENKTVITIDCQQYLLELPLKADVALIKADTADQAGNLVYSKTARNFNPLMAMAASTVIAEVEHLSAEMINPDHVETPAIFVDYIVKP